MTMPSSSLTCLNCVSKLHFLKNQLVSVTFQRPKNAKPSTAKYWWMFSPDQTVVIHKEFYPVCTILREKLRSYQATEGSYLTAAGGQVMILLAPSSNFVISCSISRRAPRQKKLPGPSKKNHTCPKTHRKGYREQK